LEKYRTLAQHQLAIRQSRFLGFAVTEMLNRFLQIVIILQSLSAIVVKKIDF